MPTTRTPRLVFSAVAGFAVATSVEFGQCLENPTGGNEPAPSIRVARDDDGNSVVELTVPSTTDQPPNEDAAPDFRLYVVTADKLADEPPVLGSSKTISGGVRFMPRFPLQPGLRYRAQYHAADGATITEEFQMPDRPPAEATAVAAVYPTAATLPENQLKFYLHFTAAMGRGEAYDHLRLLDDTGGDLDLPFLEIGEELWDPSGKRLTLLLDPARVKRGLKPREEQGPVLMAGRRYTLVVDRRWRDATGRPLRAEFRKRFAVGPADETSPDPRRWRLSRPAAGSREALVARFAEPLDQALLERMLWVVDADGRRLPGDTQIGEHEASWSFTPEHAWQPGTYQLMADTLLEDLAGNSISRKFEVEPTGPPPRNERASIKFTVSASGE